MYKTLTVTVEGVKPLMVHNVQLANPLNPVVKQIKSYSGKRKKTDEDIIVLAKLEWLGGLYTSEPIEDIIVKGEDVEAVGGGKLILPAEGLKAALVSAGKKFKLGSTVSAAILIDDDAILHHSNEKLDINGLLQAGKNFDTRAVTVNRAKIMRTRPVFYNWSLKFDIQYLPDMLSKSQLNDLLDAGGRVCGMFEYRPRFGTYRATIS